MRGLCCFQGGQRGGQNSPDIKRYQALRAGAVAKCMATWEGPFGPVPQKGCQGFLPPRGIYRKIGG